MGMSSSPCNITNEETEEAAEEEELVSMVSSFVLLGEDFLLLTSG
jgi:hypothetical protein